MQDFLVTIENDSTLMLTVGVALAVLLIILLVTVVSAMRVKTYKETYWDTKVDNEEKTAYIAELEHALEASKRQNTADQQALEAFAETRETLKSTNETLHVLQEKHTALEKELAQTRTDLEHAREIHTALQEEHHLLKERHEVVVEENSRCRTNNARLLMKLESMERQGASSTRGTDKASNKDQDI